MSAFSFLRATLLVFLATLLYTASCYVLDTQGDLVENGGVYSIFASGGYLGFRTREADSPTRCSDSYVVLRIDRASPPPVKISQKSRQRFLDGDRDLSLDSGGDPTCRRSGIWRVAKDDVTGRLLVLGTGGSFRKPTSLFRIQKFEGAGPFDYKLVYCSEDENELCQDVGLFEDGHAGIGGKPLAIKIAPHTRVIQEVVSEE